uniref:Putative secreted peptide n=1 Tax=Anopheles braziliensis TaxID=58242 RepID=A0A2M3ZVM7_9DIPT
MMEMAFGFAFFLSHHYTGALVAATRSGVRPRGLRSATHPTTTAMDEKTAMDDTKFGVPSGAAMRKKQRI